MEALKRPPRRLAEIIDQKLERVRRKEFGQDAMKLLKLCGLTARSLKLTELQEALNISSRQKVPPSVQVRKEIGAVIDNYCGLISIGEVIDNCCGLISIEEEDDTVHFIHHSVKEHLSDTFSEKKNTNRLEPSHHRDDDSDLSDANSIITSFSFADSVSSKSSLAQPILFDAVEIFSTSLLRNTPFQELCKSALLERQIPRPKVHRNLERLLRLFASHLGQETQSKEHLETVQFVRRASFRIATRILQSPEILGPSRPEEFKLGQLEQETSRARIDKYLKSHGKQAEPSFSQEDEDQRANSNSLPGHKDNGQGASDSDEESSLDGLDEQEAQDDMAEDGHLRIEDFLFRTNSFLVMEREFENSLTLFFPHFAPS